MTFLFLYIHIKNMITKSKITITIDKENNYDLDKYCNNKFINKSKLINSLVKEYLEKIKITNEDKNNRRIYKGC